MPTQQLPTELGGYDAYTGIADVRPAAGNRPGLECFNSVSIQLYDLPPNSSAILFSGELDLGTFRSSSSPKEAIVKMSVLAVALNSNVTDAVNRTASSMVYSGRTASAQTNDIITLVRLDADEGFCMYNHTTGTFGSQAHQRQVWRVILQDYGWRIFWILFWSPILPVSLILAYFTYKKMKSRGVFADSSQSPVMAWVKMHCSPKDYVEKRREAAQVQSI